MNDTLLTNPHAGEILKQEFLDELQITTQALSLAIGISLDNIEFIIRGKSNITADIDLRLCRYFGLSEGYFLRLQNAYELMEAKRKLGETLNQIQPLAIL
jgi:addiction module HigA family antidote